MTLPQVGLCGIIRQIHFSEHLVAGSSNIGRAGPAPENSNGENRVANQGGLVATC